MPRLNVYRAASHASDRTVARVIARLCPPLFAWLPAMYEHPGTGPIEDAERERDIANDALTGLWGVIATAAGIALLLVSSWWIEGSSIGFAAVSVVVFGWPLMLFLEHGVVQGIYFGRVVGNILRLVLGVLVAAGTYRIFI